MFFRLVSFPGALRLRKTVMCGKEEGEGERREEGGGERRVENRASGKSFNVENVCLNFPIGSSYQSSFSVFSRESIKKFTFTGKTKTWKSFVHRSPLSVSTL